MVEEQNIKPTPTDVASVPQPPTEPQLTEEEIEKWLAQKGSVPKAVRNQIAIIRRQRRLKEKKIVRVQKEDRMEKFLEEFIKNGGNATQAALAIGNHSTIQSAAVSGHNYLKKAKGLSRIYLEKKGYTFGKMMDVAAEKMMTSKTPDWWDRLMKMADYADFITKKETRPAVVNILQAQKDLQRQFGFVDGEIVEEDDGDEEL